MSDDRSIDLNADIGEGFGPWRMGEDGALMEVITSANVACGFHAGDPSIMASTVGMAKARNVDIGAHVGYPDLQGFGRRAMAIDPGELAHLVVYQLGALSGLARAAGYRMTHMSFHGALGNKVARESELAETLIAAVASFDDSLIVSTSPSEAVEAAAARHGLKTARTFLADRAYDEQGLLIPRGMAGAVIHDPAIVLARVRQLLTDGSVTTHQGARIRLRAQSILLHGDTPSALELAQRTRAEIEALGIRLLPISLQLA
jgi:5-oxoprolinase (ATP-hydrolysing) subunit A